MDIFTEPSDVDPDTLANLGPLRGLAGTWRGVIGGDVAPKAAGPERSVYVETQRLDPIDPQTNGPQVFYGLRYHIHINKVGEDITFHNQVGYWLWEPATGLVMQTLAIPRGQSLLARGQAKPQDRSFFVTARAGASDYGICSTTFLEKHFRTLSYRIDVTCEDDAFSYVTTTDMMVGDAAKAFDHSDRNRLTRIAPPQPNPLFATLQARGEGGRVSAAPDGTSPDLLPSSARRTSR